MVSKTAHDIRYQPDERPPHTFSLGMGLQAAVLVFAGVVLTPVIVVRAAGGSKTYLAWMVFMALAVRGATTVLLAVRSGHFGSRHMLLSDTSGVFIAVCVTTLVSGGPALLATLIILTVPLQLVLAARLSLLRRFFTPVVLGTVIVLLTVTIMPLAFDMLKEVPEGASPATSPASAATTLGVIVATALCASGT